MASGIFTLPLDILVSGILTAQSGSPYTAPDPAVGFHNHPGFYVGPYGPQTRAVVGGELAPVNGERNDAWTNFDFRLTKRFDLGGAQLEALFEVFNVLNSLWWNPGERRERRGARLTRRVREEYLVYFDRNATMSGAKRRGSAGMHRRSNAAWVSPQAVNTATFRVSGSDQQEPVLDDGAPNPEFGLGSARVGAQRRAQLGLRIVF